MSRNNPDEEDSGATKLWSIYVDEAAKYDQSLVESWRSDMDGILIFAGLFSASLTAFLVESYTTLTPDPTIQLLTQISQQISVMGSNMTIASQASSSPFQPPKSALICNAFWFISLGLSLASALIATLLEQWTRDFLHRANMRSSPVVRARVYSYLYYGLRRFQLHAVVDLLPALLHGALFFFFGGLVAFLIPVNIIMAGLVGAILLLALGFYIFFTILPIFASDSPYRTPFTNGIWNAWHIITGWWFQQTVSPSIVLNMFQHAQDSTKRAHRDLQALSWTVQSLSDQEEFQAFFDAIPDAILNSKTYANYLTQLWNTYELNLPLQVVGLLHSCNNSWLLADTVKHRLLTCFQGLWAICSISSAPYSWKYPAMLLETIRELPIEVYGKDRSLQGYAISASTMLQWNTSLQLRGMITSHQPEHQTGTSFQISSFVLWAEAHLKQFELDKWQKPVNSGRTLTAIAAVKQFSQLSPEYRKDIYDLISRTIFFHYFYLAAKGGVLPYRWVETCGIVIPSFLDTTSMFNNEEIEYIEQGITSTLTGLNEHVLQKTGMSSGVADLKAQRMEVIVAGSLEPILTYVCKLWRPQAWRVIPASLLELLHLIGPLKNNTLIETLASHLWYCIFETVLDIKKQFMIPGYWDSPERGSSYENLMFILWLLLYKSADSKIERPSRDLLHEIQQQIISLSDVPMSPLVNALMKSTMLAISTPPAYHTWSQLHALLPSESIYNPPLDHDIPIPSHEFYARLGEGQIETLAQLLESMQAVPFTKQAAETVDKVDIFTPVSQVLPKHQMHFGQQLRRIVEIKDIAEDEECCKTLRAIVQSKIFAVYSEAPDGYFTYSIELNPAWPTVHQAYISWIDSVEARKDIEYALCKLLSILPDSSKQVERILQGIKTKHP